MDELWPAKCYKLIEVVKEVNFVFDRGISAFQQTILPINGFILCLQSDKFFLSENGKLI
jgi:hypothetical protein